jgi:hypothetical protein
MDVSAERAAACDVRARPLTTASQRFRRWRRRGGGPGRHRDAPRDSGERPISAPDATAGLLDHASAVLDRRRARTDARGSRRAGRPDGRASRQITQLSPAVARNAGFGAGPQTLGVRSSRLRSHVRPDRLEYRSSTRLQSRSDRRSRMRSPLRLERVPAPTGSAGTGAAPASADQVALANQHLIAHADPRCADDATRSRRLLPTGTVAVGRPSPTPGPRLGRAKAPAPSP